MRFVTEKPHVTLIVGSILVVVLCTLVVSGRLEEVYEEDFLGEVKVTVARTFSN